MKSGKELVAEAKNVIADAKYAKLVAMAKKTVAESRTESQHPRAGGDDDTLIGVFGRAQPGRGGWAG